MNSRKFSWKVARAPGLWQFKKKEEEVSFSLSSYTRFRAAFALCWSWRDEMYFHKKTLTFFLESFSFFFFWVVGREQYSAFMTNFKSFLRMMVLHSLKKWIFIWRLDNFVEFSLFFAVSLQKNVRCALIVYIYTHTCTILEMSWRLLPTRIFRVLYEIFLRLIQKIFVKFIFYSNFNEEKYFNYGVK